MGPRRQDSNTLVIVIVVIAVILVVGGGGCLMCVGLAAVASDADDAGPNGVTTTPTSAPGVPGRAGLSRTPLAIQLEDGLRAQKVPVGSVVCPTSPPSTGSFVCVLATPEGDRSDVVVTLGPKGMAYDIPNVAFLEGAKLETTFRSLVSRSNPRLRAPCLTGTLMKPVGRDFTCPVFDGATEAGTLTVSVLDKSGQVKMTVEANGNPSPSPSPTPSPTAPSGGDTAGVDGRYECFQMRVVAGPNFTFNTTWVPGALPGFTIAGGSYRSAGGSGTVGAAGTVVTFTGGPYGGWAGATDTNSTGFYIRFRGDDHGNPRPGVGAKSGDYQCYRQRG